MNLYLVEDFVPLLVLTDDQQAFPKDLEFPSLFVFFFFCGQQFRDFLGGGSLWGWVDSGLKNNLPRS
jgi:hypothetical protein